LVKLHIKNYVLIETKKKYIFFVLFLLIYVIKYYGNLWFIIVRELVIIKQWYAMSNIKHIVESNDTAKCFFLKSFKKSNVALSKQLVIPGNDDKWNTYTPWNPRINFKDLSYIPTHVDYNTCCQNVVNFSENKCRLSGGISNYQQ